MLGRPFMLLAWPAFLAACLLELLVFAVVDPQDLHWAGGMLGWSRPVTYSLGFFAFWTICLAASGLTAVLGRAATDVNRPLRPPS